MTILEPSPWKRRSRATGGTTAPMTSVVSDNLDNLWPTLRALARKSATKLAAVSYVTTSKFVAFGRDDVLVVDATDEAIRTRLCDAKVLSRAVGQGAEVYSLPGLHAKVLVLGGTAVVGSANISMTSASSLRLGACLIVACSDLSELRPGSPPSTHMGPPYTCATEK